LIVPWKSARVLYAAVRQWNANQDLRWGAALAYYALFSVAPLLVIAIDIAALVFGAEAARGGVEQQLAGWIGHEPAQAAQSLLQHAGQGGHSAWPIISYILLVVGALGAFLHLRTALCFIWKLEPPQGGSLLAIVLDYALALAMVFIVGALLLVSLAAAVVITFVHAYFGEEIPGSALLWQIVEIGVSLVLLALLFAVTYRVLSGRRIAWNYVMYGSIIAALLFTVGKVLLSYYLVFTGTASSYGAAGSVVVFLMWVYYSSQVLFFGAELIQARRTLNP
jgi:membrane protein